jgi:tetratricopeptide (TPR) repeat protein
MGKAGDWAFTKRFRRGAFGWRASRLACERIAEALAEIRAAARHDPLHAAEGAVRFLVKLSPALEHVDSSSGALGSAARAAVDPLVPVIAQAPADGAMRDRWLEQLFEAIQNDDPPYLELLDERWGDLCATPEMASRWADRLIDLVRHVHAERRQGRHAFSRAESACYSALFAAGRHDELIKLIAGDPRPMWHDLLWIGRIKVAEDQVDEAIAFMANSVNAWTPLAGLARFAESVLLEAGRRTEAYEKYALEANRATTYLATYRLVSKKYPEIEPDRLLSDLISTTPGEEGKWFATAKTLKRFDLAMQLAWKSPCDPKTLIRAARDNVGKDPSFASEVALAALHWICQGRGYELTSLDVQMTYRLASEAGNALGQSERVALRIQTMLRPSTREVRWVREMPGVPASPETGAP